MQVCPACGEENPERARFCLACGSALEEAPSLGEERKVVSVLFVDLVGFTDRSDRADPEDVRALLRPYHEGVKADIERFGGTVEKFIGDAVMAVFGAPVAHEDDAERAVRSALRILETIEELREGGLELSVRAAVTTGEAVVALGARPERGEGIVTGDVVNTAARLQAAAPVGGVIVDRSTARSAGSAVDFEPLAPVEAKGKTEPIPVWQATAARSRVGEPEAGTRTPLVGREHERTLLVESFLRVERESMPQLVTVVGEPGVGKSRLVTELRVFLDDRPEIVTWRHGRCLPYGEGITFWALGEVVKAEAGVLESDDAGEAEAKLERAVTALFDDASEREWLQSRLSPLVGAGGDAGGVGRDEAFAAWRRFLEAMAARRPTVLVLEDVHWADDALLDFLEHVLDWAAPVPLLVLATARPELYDRRSGWSGGKRNATTISVSPLTEEDTARLLQILLGRAVLEADTQASILERAGGNPLYTEQFARMLGERRDDRELPLPEGVQALIAARLDTLPPETKALLQDASVVGRTFWTGAVCAIGRRDREAVLAGIRELVRRELVRPARVSSVKGDEEFSIWHALVRDVAYQQIPRARRAEKHVAAAAWIEGTAEARIADHADILVHHYEQAHELTRAAGDVDADLRASLARVLVLSGDRATRLDMEAAEVAYRRALEVGEGEPGREAILVKLAEALGELGRLSEAEQAFEEALPALRLAGDDRATARALRRYGRTLWQRGNTRRGREMRLEAVSIIEHDPSPDLVKAYEGMAAAESLGGRPREALMWADKAIALAGRLGVEDVVRAHQNRAIARVDLGDPGGLDDGREAVALAERLGLAIETAIGYLNHAESVVLVESLAAGLELMETSLELSYRRGLTHNVMWTRAARLPLLYELGAWDELLSDADEVLDWDRGLGGTQIESYVLASRSPVLVQREMLDEAARDVATFLPHAREIGDLQSIRPALLHAALVSAARGRSGKAVALVGELAGVADRIRVEAGPAVVARVCVAAGDPDLAERVVKDMIEVPGQFASASFTASRAIVCEARGELDEAARLYRESADGWLRWGSVVERAQAQLGVGRCAGDEQARREGERVFDDLRAVPFAALAA